MIASSGIFKHGSQEVDRVYKGNSIIWQKLLNSVGDPPIQELTSPGVLRLTTANTQGFPSLYYPKMYLSAPFKPYFSGITKDYIFLYSTNHANPWSGQNPGNGAIGWGECDGPDLSGYVDRGIIISGFQSETPSLIINPNDPNGQHIWFFYHPTTNHPDSGGYQQTRLFTTTGGVYLHNTSYTDRGKVLGFTPSELATPQPHSGYADAYMENNGSITVFHATKGWNENTLAGIPNIGISKSLGNTYAFTRFQSDIDTTSFMPSGRMFHGGPSLFFKRNNIQYCVARSVLMDSTQINTNNYISIYQADGNYQLTSFVSKISSLDGGDNSFNSGYFIDETNEPDILHVYYIKNNTQLFHTTWDLRNLD